MLQRSIMHQLVISGLGNPGVGKGVRSSSFKVLLLCMMSESRRQPPLEAPGLNAPRGPIVGLQ